MGSATDQGGTTGEATSMAATTTTTATATTDAATGGRLGDAVPQQPPAPQAQQPRKKRRVFMWVILAINALFLWWIIAGVGGTADNCAGEVGDALESCQTGTAIGTGIGIIFIIFLWAMVDVILGVIYIVTRRRND